MRVSSAPPSSGASPPISTRTARPGPAWSRTCSPSSAIWRAAFARHAAHEEDSMNWLTNFVPPKLRQLVARDTPENLWQQCPSCSQMIYRRELEKARRVCPHCGHHMRLGAKARLALLFDDGAYTLETLASVPVDPLRFRDQKRYTDRLKDAQSKTSLQDAVLVAHGTIGGMPAVTAAFEFDFMGGSMGVAVGERSEEHTSELQSLMRISYAVFCLKKKKTHGITK